MLGIGTETVCDEPARRLQGQLLAGLLADERQVIVSLTEEGRRLREQVDATGLDAFEFRALQQAIVKLRNSLLKLAQEPRAEESRKSGMR